VSRNSTLELPVVLPAGQHTSGVAENVAVNEMFAEQFINKLLFRLAFNYEVQPNQLRAALYHVLLPQFGQRILFQPVL